MKTVINADKGDSINHFAFGSGTISDITDKYIEIDFKDKKKWKAAIFPSDKITANGSPLIQRIYDEQIADYEIFIEYVATDYGLSGAIPIIKASLKECGVSEEEAINLVRQRITSYKNYQGGFWITNIIKSHGRE